MYSPAVEGRIFLKNKMTAVGASQKMRQTLGREGRRAPLTQGVLTSHLLVAPRSPIVAGRCCFTQHVGTSSLEHVNVTLAGSLLIPRHLIQ